ncbi:hypothetical protein [Lactiplantibacillus fabifermentans]|uniref:Uncharacterized protein n=2 Tax=Lactiplantibacillus fabifermentans TaxID=483011 RepID=A0A0R2NMJ7_9LACO|nr:hypothetical protein [Lactiplantibacillus fabifermentans]ETY74741.1 hypothetical protein LFAB_05520 [Lactiplantibacillus fabifermentans T30PCM01]KRO26933.1 hypothetical protein DY78_GL000501 [Lactiplantibacillus fabifermentans DSM 21115]
MSNKLIYVLGTIMLVMGAYTSKFWQIPTEKIIRILLVTALIIGVAYGLKQLFVKRA